GAVINAFASGAGSASNPFIDATGTFHLTGAGGAAIAGNQSVGGLVGLNQGLIINSHADVSVYGASNVGGLAGFAQTTANFKAVMLNDYATGAVYAGGLTSTVGNAAGGFVGDNAGGVITNSYSTGSV